MNEDKHIPVLLEETLDSLHIKSLGLYIDATVGAGGHSAEILKRGGNVLGLDTDNSMLEIAREKLEKSCPTVDAKNRPSFKLIHANFRQIKDVATKEGFSPANGILFDLGVSSVHFDDMNRGFSFKNPDAELDMRLDRENLQLKASDLVNSLRLDKLRNCGGFFTCWKIF
ncbi:16S rRNA (cytosine(1402)-N(4))-methyltransferase [Candidatus Microgenomates bacterium]|nr:16S rRNA (cytosine(1402)-N(4))-methyltransferase [Candidatus Microgenomates bacterium]